MLMDLFSTFDPNSKLLGLSASLNWLSVSLGIIFSPLQYWVKPQRIFLLIYTCLIMVAKEFKVIMKGKLYSSYHLFISLFFMILMNNFLGMFPFIFTATSHLVFSLTFSMILWMSFMIYGWTKFTNSMFVHLVPSGTPAPLMPFMVCIETISNVIRSGTLAVRLSANMISGHLLLTLTGGQGPNLPMILCFILILSQIILLVLEFSVSFIQAYVFSVLSALYSGESTGN
uniref:ATP synthase subunit a n=1 Tax=Aeolothrips indicus TaxID=2856552 RepID=A0A8F5J8C9_9NEOP|nr:ATP synthase F0 subunit 6 [Aeolothrips indicus]